jgi:hypothetical protein
MNLNALANHPTVSALSHRVCFNPYRELMSLFEHDRKYGARLATALGENSLMPNPRWAQEALKAALLEVRAEVTSKRSTPKRREEIAACDWLLDRLANLASQGAVR